MHYEHVHAPRTCTCRMNMGTDTDMDMDTDMDVEYNWGLAHYTKVRNYISTLHCGRRRNERYDSTSLLSVT
jgi:hypothetical protein